MPKLLLFVFAFCTDTLFAQNIFIYQPLQYNNVVKQALFDSTEQHYRQDVAALTGDNKKYIADIYKARFDEIKHYYNDSMVVTDNNAQHYLQSILAEIVTNNSVLKNVPLQVLFLRAWWPNASSAGEGTIFFNIGLFNRLQNESQVAFVLCHEIAHQYFNHSNEHIQLYVNTVYSDTFQRKLQQIKKTEYGKRELLEQTITGISFSSHRHGREHEVQADSMALEFLKNTHYNASSAITCLKLLDSVDNDKYNVQPKPDSFFNNAKYPFQQAWIKQENGFFSQLAVSSRQTTAEADSLKTHPDCGLRVANVQNQLTKYSLPAGRNYIVFDSAAFAQLQQTFDFEILNYNCTSGNLSRSLYYSLQMLQFYPDNKFIVTNIGRCFNKMYEAQKNHVLGKIVEAPSPSIEKKYNDFLQFLQQLRLADIAAVNYYFLTAYEAKFSADKDFAEVYSDSRRIFNN